MKDRLRFICLIVFMIAAPIGYGSTLPSPLLKTNLSQQYSVVNVIYKSGILSIQGLTGQGNVKLFSIIGNEIAAYPNVDLYNFQRNINLTPSTMYIIHVEQAGEIKLFKLIAR